MYMRGCAHAVIDLELVCLATCIEPYRVQVMLLLTLVNVCVHVKEEPCAGAH